MSARQGEVFCPCRGLRGRHCAFGPTTGPAACGRLGTADNMLKQPLRSIHVPAARFRPDRPQDERKTKYPP